MGVPAGIFICCRVIEMVAWKIPQDKECPFMHSKHSA
jgi:hypothetical protein